MPPKKIIKTAAPTVKMVNGKARKMIRKVVLKKKARPKATFTSMSEDEDDDDNVAQSDNSDDNDDDDTSSSQSQDDGAANNKHNAAAPQARGGRGGKATVKAPPAAVAAKVTASLAAPPQATPPVIMDDRAIVLKHLSNMQAVLKTGIKYLSVGCVPTPGGSGSAAQAASNHSSINDIGGQTLLCREQQVTTILSFLSSDAHPALQLFGMPGTGKTAAVKNAVSRFARQKLGPIGTRPRAALVGDDMAAVADLSDVVSVIFFNGYVMQRPTDVFAALLRHLTRYRLQQGDKSVGGAGLTAAQQQALNANRIAPHQAAAQLEKRFARGWGSHFKRYEDIPLCVIVIDEMDKCCEHSGKTLFRLVDWLTMPFAKCKMITIANAMQLPERLDPKTRSRLNTTQRVTFPSYSPEQLQDILKQRLDAAHQHIAASLGLQGRVMSAAAEQYICRQVGLHNGDVRRLLQTSAAALQDVLVLIDDFASKVKMVGQVTRQETQTALEALGLPSIEEAVNGVAQVRHLSAVARNVLHDRFQDFLSSINSPLMYTIILLIASESIKQSAIARREVATSQLPLDNLFMLVRATVDAYVKLDVATGTPAPPISMTQFLCSLEVLRQVNYIELCVGDGEATLRDATTAVKVSEPVFVTIIHPPHDIVARCEGHALHEVIGKSIMKRNQLV